MAPTWNDRFCTVRAGSLLALGALLIACSAGDGDGLDESGRPLGESGGGPVITAFDQIQQQIFDPVCIQCHIGASAPQGLRLDSGNSYLLLVDVPSAQVPNILRVRPGDSANSYLMQKILGTAAVGERMPLGLPPLTQAQIDLIRDWIDDGAMPGSSVVVMAQYPGARY